MEKIRKKIVAKRSYLKDGFNVDGARVKRELRGRFKGPMGI